MLRELVAQSQCTPIYFSCKVAIKYVFTRVLCEDSYQTVWMHNAIFHGLLNVIITRYAFSQKA